MVLRKDQMARPSMSITSAAPLNILTLGERYATMEFTAREEWVAEQTLVALTTLLRDVRCTNTERHAVEEFLVLAAEELPGVP